ncbi:hypothetical protein BYT27DRAFT_6895259 [Phlegmacium glaucopus]|nr:hypothetical protein BYT27DRAFT_6895259 [Phlegmacium glaucopus]
MASYYKVVERSLARNWSADWIQGHSISRRDIERNKTALFALDGEAAMWKNDIWPRYTCKTVSLPMYVPDCVFCFNTLYPTHDFNWV